MLHPLREEEQRGQAGWFLGAGQGKLAGDVSSPAFQQSGLVESISGVCFKSVYPPPPARSLSRRDAMADAATKKHNILFKGLCHGSATRPKRVARRARRAASPSAAIRLRH